MAPQRIAPEDVSAQDAQKILAFLNAATSAQQIADGIELADEPDVGRRLAEHLLAARQQVGGTFTSLVQVAAVPLIGPVRFTRIVRALAPPKPAADAEIVQELIDEVRELRAELEALRGTSRAPRVTLRLVEPSRYLGQPATVIARVQDAGGRPLGDASVALATTWGRFHAADGFTIQDGTGVVVRTAADGQAALALLPPTSEDLDPVEEDALVSQLDLLEPDADTPQAILQELQDFVRQYRWEVNDELRGAVDIYFRDFHAHLVDRVNFRDDLVEEWRVIDAVVLAHVVDRNADGTLDSAIQASASLDVEYRDWLGPWLQVYNDLAESESTLSDQLGLATNSENADDLLGRVHTRVGTFVSQHPGVVGQLVGQRVAGDALDTFLSKQVDKLPVQAQQRVFPTARAATGTLGTRGGVASFQAFAETRADVRASVTEGVTASPEISSLQTAVSAVQAQLNLKIDVGSFNAAMASKVDETAFNAALANKVDQTAFEATLATKVDQKTFDDALRDRFVDRATFEAATANFVDRTTFDAAIKDRVDRTTFDGAILDKVDQTTFDAAIAEKVDNTVFTGAIANTVDQAALDTALAAKADQTAVNQALAAKADQTAVNQALAAKADQTAVNQALAGKADQTAVNTALAGKADQATVNTALASKVDTATLNQTLASARNLTDLQRGVPVVRRIGP